MNTVLLVWEEIPETTKLFMLELTDNDYEKILLCHGLFINSSDMSEEQEEAMRWLNEDLIINNKPFYDDTVEISSSNTFIGEFTVIVAGFVL